MIWLVGNKGMLGTEVSQSLEASNLDVVCSDTDVDIRDFEAVQAFSRKHRPTWIINCAAYTAVDRAEDEPEAAFNLNVQAVENLARAAARSGARMLHISTDYVFSSNENRELSEDEPTTPTSVYGTTKAQGEAVLRRELPEHVIVRTAWLYGIHGSNFVKTMLRLMNERPELRVVNDQHGTPTYAVDLAQVIVQIIQNGEFPSGTYHFTNAGRTTWYEFAAQIQSVGNEIGLLGSDCTIHPISTDEYPTKATRPAYSLLSTSKIQRTLGITPPDWKESLHTCLLQLLHSQESP